MCFKVVPDDGELRVDRATGAVDTSGARRAVSAYDRNAVEAARVLAGQAGDELVGLTVGDSAVRAGVKDVLARGAAAVVHVVTDGATVDGATAGGEPDGHVTAGLLAAQVRALGDAGLVVCGEAASDSYAHEVGPRVAALLGWPVVSQAREAHVADGVLHAVRVVGDEDETVECDLPAVLTVLPEIGPAPIPGLKAVLAANRGPVTAVPAADLGLAAEALARRTHVTALTAFITERARTVIDEGSAQEKVAALVDGLVGAGVLR